MRRHSKIKTSWNVCAYDLWLPWLMFFRAFSSVVRQMPGFNSQSRGRARTLKLVVTVLCYRLYSCAVVIVLLLFVFVLLLFVLFYVLKLCVLQHCHRVLTQLQSSNILTYIYIYIYIYDKQNSDMKSLIKFGTTTSCSSLFGLLVFTTKKFNPKT